MNIKHIGLVVCSLVIGCAGMTHAMTPQYDDTKDIIDWSYHNGLTKYKTNETFRGADYITRGEAAKFINQYGLAIGKRIDITKKQQCQFSDIGSYDSSLVPHIKEACQRGLIQGYQGKYMPYDTLTQEQALAIAMRAQFGVQNETVSPWWKPYHILAQNNKLTLRDFSAATPAQRLVMARWLYQVYKNTTGSTCDQKCKERCMLDKKLPLCAPLVTEYGGPVVSSPTIGFRPHVLWPAHSVYHRHVDLKMSAVHAKVDVHNAEIILSGDQTFIKNTSLKVVTNNKTTIYTGQKTDAGWLFDVNNMVLPQGDEAKFVFGLQRDENAQIDEYIEGAIRFSTTQYDPSYVKSAKKDIFQSRAFVILSESPLRVEYADGYTGAKSLTNEPGSTVDIKVTVDNRLGIFGNNIKLSMWRSDIADAYPIPPYDDTYAITGDALYSFVHTLPLAHIVPGTYSVSFSIGDDAPSNVSSAISNARGGDPMVGFDLTHVKYDDHIDLTIGELKKMPKYGAHFYGYEVCNIGDGTFHGKLPLVQEVPDSRNTTRKLSPQSCVIVPYKVITDEKSVTISLTTTYTWIDNAKNNTKTFTL